VRAPKFAESLGAAVDQLPEDPADCGTALTLLFHESGNISPTVGDEGLFGGLYRPDDQRDSAFTAGTMERFPGRPAVRAVHAEVDGATD
jgi:hypothetical protein